MKRILFAIAVMALSASSAFASATITSSTSIGGSSISFAPSNKVSVYVTSAAGNSTTTPPDPGGFAAEAQHSSGSRYFGVNSISTKIYWKDGLGAATPSSATEAFSGWNTM